MRRRLAVSFTLAAALLLGASLAAAGDDDAKESETPKLAPEALLCVKIARKDVVKGSAVDGYIDLLADADVEGWNAKRKKDQGKVLDLAAKTWDARGRDDLVLKLEGLDLHGIDLSNVIFAPGTSFAFSNLDGASFRGSCLEGVKFTSIWSFEERTAKKVRSTSLSEADFRDVVWTWCSALERTVKRAGERRRRESAETKRKRTEAEQQRLMEELRRLQMNGRGASDPFAFCDVSGIQLDKDAPYTVLDDEERDPSQPVDVLHSRTVERLIRATREGTVERAIGKLCARRKTARTREVANPLKAEPALAAAIAATSSAYADIATWKAVTLAEQTGRGEEATIVEGEKTLLVVDGPRSVASTPLLVAQGAIFAWRNAVLPLTFAAGPLVLKDQSFAQGVVHGSTVFALSDRLRGDRRMNPEQSGTFHSPVVVEVQGVDNLSEAEAERRALQDAKLKEYAQAQGDLWEGARVYDPTKDSDGTEPEKALPADIRKQVLDEVGKTALDEMRCYKISGNQAQNYQAVISNDPKAIVVVAGNYTGHGSIYSEGPIVFLEGKQRAAWVQRCVSKSWVAIKGEPRVGQFTILGKRVDIEKGNKDE